MRNSLGSVQSVLVLGAGSDIAQATVRRLVADGCRRFVLAARDLDGLSDISGELRDAGATTVEAVRFDALDVGGHRAVVDAATAAVGDLDVVLLAFGVLGDQAVFDADPVAAAEAAQVNFGGAVSIGLVAANQLRAQGHGTIVVLSSVAGERTRASNHVYGATKAGLDAFAQGLGDSLVGTGVRVVSVRPGFVHSKMTNGMDPAPFATTPDVVAGAIVGAIASGRETVWVPSVLRWVFVAFRHLPRAVWRKVSARA